MERQEISLGQGWAKGLTMAFENESASRDLNPDSFFHVEQVHGAKIYEVTAQDLKRTGPLAKADILVARGDWFKGQKRPLMVKSADCAPLLFVQHKAQTVAAAHAGWRGLQQGAHRVLFDQGYLEPRETWVWLGPSLNGPSFEVGEDMWSQFPKYKSDPQIFAETSTTAKKCFYPWRFLEEEFKELGVELFYNLEVDTFANLEFASYRRVKKQGKELNGALNYSWIGFHSPKT